MRWTAMVAAFASALLDPSSAHAERILLITDPNASTKAATLLELAVVEELQSNRAVTVLTPTELTPKQSHAAKWIEEAAKVLQGARLQFDQLELDTALKQFSRATKKLDKAMPHVTDIRPLLDSLTMLTATYLLVGQERKARSALERLLVLDIDARANEVFNPQMAAVFEAEVSRIRGWPSFNVEVTVDPPSAAVFFDGRLVGAAPITVTGVRKGHHYVTATLKGFETAGRAIELKSRSSRNVSLKLNEAARDSRLEAQASASIAAMDTPDLPGEARQLLDTLGANRAVLLAVTRNNARLVAYDADGGRRHAARAETSVNDLSTARSVARSLLGGVGRSDEAGHDETEDESVVDASDDSGTTGSVAAAVSGKKPGRGAGGGDSDDADGSSGETVSAWDSVSTASVPSTTTPSGGSYLFSPNPTKEMALYAAYGGGILLAAAGGVFGALGLAAQNEYYERTSLQGAKIDHDATTDQIEGQDVAAAGRRDALIADILYGAAGVAIITGLLLHFAWEPGEPTASTTGRPGHGSAAAWSYEFGPGFLRVDF